MDLKKEDDIPSSSAILQIESFGIKYRIVNIPPGIHCVNQSAEAAGIPIQRAFKTLLLKSKFNEFLLCNLPYIQQIDTKKLSIVSSLTGLSMAPTVDIAPIIGSECNTVSPLGLCQALPYYVDNQLFEDCLVYLGSGISDVVIEVSSVDLLNSLHPVCGDFSK